MKNLKNLEIKRHNLINDMHNFLYLFLVSFKHLTHPNIPALQAMSTTSIEVKKLEVITGSACIKKFSIVGTQRLSRDQNIIIYNG